MDQKRLMIQDLNNTAQSILHYYHEQELKGLLSREEARQKAIEHLRHLRYGPENKDYFWINDMHPHMIMHPFRPDLEGHDISDYADPAGKRLFSEFVKVVKKSGSGFVDYQWQWKDDPDNIVPKISYVKAFEPWGWITGTGVYIEDIREEIATVRKRVLLAGTGLGLSTVYGIVRQHEGMINVYSEEGKGTTFKIYLPAAQETRKESTGQQEEIPGGNETLLIAEDNEEVRRLARQHLEKAGYTVFTAANGRQAITIFEEAVGKIDMAILDVIMPEMGGQAVFEYLRSVKPDLPVLFASGYSPNAIHTNFVLHTGLELIQKPYSRRALLKKVRVILDNATRKNILDSDKEQKS